MWDHVHAGDYICTMVCVCAREIESVYHRVCVSYYKLLYKCAESRPGQSVNWKYSGYLWKKKGKQYSKKHLTHQDLHVICPLLRLFFLCLIRRIKRTLSSLNICDHIQMYFCPGLVEISASRTDSAGAIIVLVQHIQEHSAGMTRSSLSSSFPWFSHFVILSSLGSFAFRLLGAPAFVSLLLRPSVLPGWLIERGAVGRGGVDFSRPSKLEGSGRGRLHDLLTDFADLQLQTHLCGEGVWEACLEGSSGLSWRGWEK